MVIDLNDAEGIFINNQSMSRLYKNGVLLWQKPDNTFSFEGYPEFIASSLEIGSYYTTDGKVWKTTPALKRLKFTCIKFVDDVAIAGTAGTYAYKSEDGGRTWKKYQTQISGRMTSIACGNGLAVMSSISGSDIGNVWYCQYDQTGSDWEKYTGYNGPNIAGLAFCGTAEDAAGYGQFFAGTESGIYVMPTYGTAGNWIRIDSSLLNGFLWENILWSKHKQGIILASSMRNSRGQCGGIVYSTKAGAADSWHKITIYDEENKRVDSSKGSWKTLSYGNGMFVAGSVGGEFVGTIVSTDGMTWHKTGDTIPWNAIQYGNGLFVGAVNKTDKDGEELTLGLMYSENSPRSEEQDMLKVWQPSNITGREFYVVEHIDPEENQFLTGTMLKYKTTNYEKIQCIDTVYLDDRSVGLMW